eukprot:scaffold431230_cov43-Prasinocladus_malaysianus.AAC.1
MIPACGSQVSISVVICASSSRKSERQPILHSKSLLFNFRARSHPSQVTMPSADGKHPPTALLERLLNNDQYHIEYNGFLSNHAKHAIIALHGLGATPKRVQKYWDEYTAVTTSGLKLEPAEALPAK